MSKKQLDYIKDKETYIDYLLDLLSSDYIYVTELFRQCIEDIRKRFSGPNNDRVLSFVDNFIEEKEFLFNEALNNLPIYNVLNYE